MNPPFSYVVSQEMDRLLELVKSESADETLVLKIKAMSDLMLWEIRRVEAGGLVSLDTCKTFARVFDKFSADLLETGASFEVCERYNYIANRARKIGLKQP